MRKPAMETKKDIPNRCADCGAPTEKFLCDRCAEICDHLTMRGEYWFRRIRPVQEPRTVRTPRRRDRPSRPS